MTGIIVRLTEKQGKSILSAYRGVFLAYAIIGRGHALGTTLEG
jgi:hypothetical protein